MESEGRKLFNLTGKSPHFLCAIQCDRAVHCPLALHSLSVIMSLSIETMVDSSPLELQAKINPFSL